MDNNILLWPTTGPSELANIPRKEHLFAGYQQRARHQERNLCQALDKPERTRHVYVQRRHHSQAQGNGGKFVLLLKTIEFL